MPLGTVSAFSAGPVPLSALRSLAGASAACHPPAVPPPAPRSRQRRQRGGTQRRAAAAERAERSQAGTDASAASAGAAASDEPSSQQPQALLSPAALRKVTAAGDANEALDVLCAELAASSDSGTSAAAAAPPPLLSEAQCRELLLACLDRGNDALALSIFRAMSAVAASGGARPSLLSSLDGDAGGGARALAWPAASIQTAAALVVGLSRSLLTREAISLINSIRSRGLASTEDVCFGHVVGCPQDSSKPLAVVQPQEGIKTVADSFSRYEYELFSGRIASATSESLVTDQNWVLAAARRVGVLRRPAAGAVHTLLVEAPSGQQRTFRVGTATADVPAKAGDRVTLVCAPQQRSPLARRRLLGAAPHGTKPGEALSLSNHTTRTESALLRAPGPGAGAGLPSWAVPAAVVLTAGDAATTLIDPALPFIAAGAVAATLATGVAGNSLLLPRLKQLPERLLEVQATRQKLLAQHTELEARINELVDGSVEDVLMLARLWQLQSKMAAVGGETAYAARLERVVEARGGIEQRLQKRIELVDSYARVIAMIEIEVEMDADLPAAEVLGIEQQIARLSEIEALQEEWQIQAEAQDEVERMLRSSAI